MQFEKFDSKVKQAAEQHHPNYDERAWARMEKLLDRHLPQKDDRRRRIIFILLLFLLVGAGVWTWLNTDKISQTERTVGSYTNSLPEKTTAPSSTGSAKELTDKADQHNVTENKIKDLQQPAGGSAIVEQKQTGGPKTNNEPVKDSKVSGLRKKQLQKDLYEQNIEAGKVSKRGNETAGPDKDKIKKTDDNSLSTDVSAGKTGKNANSLQDDKNNNAPTDALTDKKDTREVNTTLKKDSASQLLASTEKKETVTRKTPFRKANVFSISASTGPDVSSVGVSKPGKVRFLGGIGVGYTFHDKWTIRTGFYTARKIYSAYKENYKPSSGTIPWVNYLDGINADCKVYEIPLTLAYNFRRSKNSNWYASAGLSSYIMKKEVYQYVYDAPLPVYTKTVNNENKHYFSVMDLSAGYQRRISKSFSIGAEPYIKIPLSGIGFGNVHLNSAGILFSLNLNLSNRLR